MPADKAPGFIFYPGDYLRDTQCLSENAQVAYDRIMCEHIRNICISQQQLNFFTKRLSDDEKNELLFLLVKVDGGYQIEWIVKSIEKQRAYSKSRSENRSKSKKDMKTYDTHMDNDNDNEYDNINTNKKSVVKIEKNKWNEFPQPNDIPYLPEIKVQAAITMVKFTRQKDLSKDDIEAIFEAFKAQNYTGEKYARNANEIYSHFINWIKKTDFTKIKEYAGNTGNIKSAAATTANGQQQLINRIKVNRGYD